MPGGDEADATHIYVATLPAAPRRDILALAEPEGGPEKVQALGQRRRREGGRTTRTWEIPRSHRETPTLASTGGDTSALTTRTPPDEDLLRVLDRGLA